MPKAHRRLRVFLVWLRRALAFCRCWYTMVSAAWSSRRVAVLGPSHHDCTNAEAAVRSWQTVISGFFPPPPLPYACQEQVSYRRYRLMPQQPKIMAALVVIESKFSFFILETSFHVPAREGDQQ